MSETKLTTEELANNFMITSLEELEQNKINLSIRKKSLEMSLSEVKGKLTQTLPHAEYARLSSKRSQLVQEMMTIETAILECVGRIKQCRSAKEQQKIKIDEIKSESRHVVTELVDLREYYQVFSADLSRVSSMRSMAAEFAMKLDKIIKGEIARRKAEKEASK